MFSRKKRELMKTPSISKKSRAGSPIPQTLPDLSRKDCLEAPGSSLGDLPPASSKLSSSPSAVGTLKRPTSLSRHASAAGFPLTAGAPRAMPKGHKTPTSYSPMEGGEGPFIDVEDISQLLTDVARFADALENLRDVVLRDDPKESQRPQAHECLGEALRVLRQVINKYPLLNTLETLTAAGTLISKVKGEPRGLRAPSPSFLPCAGKGGTWGAHLGAAAWMGQRAKASTARTQPHAWSAAPSRLPHSGVCSCPVPPTQSRAAWSRCLCSEGDAVPEMRAQIPAWGLPSMAVGNTLKRPAPVLRRPSQHPRFVGGGPRSPDPSWGTAVRAAAGRGAAALTAGRAQHSQHFASPLRFLDTER